MSISPPPSVVSPLQLRVSYALSKKRWDIFKSQEAALNGFDLASDTVMKIMRDLPPPLPTVITAPSKCRIAIGTIGFVLGLVASPLFLYLAGWI